MRRPTLEDVYLLLTEDADAVRLFWHQLRGEQLIFWRSREAAVFVFLFPLLLFALLTARLQRRDLTASRRPGRCSPGMLGYGAANTAFAGLALIMLVTRREMGILKRIRATPLPTATYLVAVLAVDHVRLRAAGRRRCSCSGSVLEVDALADAMRCRS